MDYFQGNVARAINEEIGRRDKFFASVHVVGGEQPEANAQSANVHVLIW